MSEDFQDRTMRPLKVRRIEDEDSRVEIDRGVVGE